MFYDNVIFLNVKSNSCPNFFHSLVFGDYHCHCDRFISVLQYLV